MKHIPFSQFTLTTALLVAASALYAQSPQSPLPISGPTTITQAGYYRLTRNIIFTGTSGNIITVQAHNVIIDFNSFFIAGPNNHANTVIGISANGFGNLTIKDGTIAFCERAIELQDTGNTLSNINQKIDSMRISTCYLRGVEVLSFSPGTVISNCQFSRIGGSTVSGTDAAVAVITMGGVLAQNNIVTAMVPTSTSSSTFGLFFTGADFAVRNVISGPCVYGVTGGKYQNNLTSGVTNPFNNGVDAGGNN